MITNPVIVRVYNANCSKILAETVVNYGEEDALMEEMRPLVQKHLWHLRAYVPPVVDVFKSNLKFMSEQGK